MSSSSTEIDPSPVSNAALAEMITDSEQRKKTRCNHVETSIKDILIMTRERRSNQTIKFNLRRRNIHTVTITTPPRKPLAFPPRNINPTPHPVLSPLSKPQQPKPYNNMQIHPPLLHPLQLQILAPRRPLLQSSGQRQWLSTLPLPNTRETRRKEGRKMRVLRG
jgi:hypothetical protein